MASSADAFFAGVLAVVRAVDARGPRSRILAVLGGIGFGVALLLQYALVLLWLVPLVVALHRRRLGPVVGAGGAALGVLGLVAVGGFSWRAGFLASSASYENSVAAERPLTYYAVANIAALALALGPALFAALPRLLDRRHRHLWLVVGGSLLALGIANLSDHSKGEVERIWLPFTVWLLPAAATLVDGESPSPRRWLSLQVGVALTLEILLRTNW